MAYSDHTEFPRGYQRFTGVSTTPVVIGEEGRNVRVAGISLTGGAGAHSIIFQDSDDVEIFRHILGIASNAFIPLRFNATNGFEVASLDTGADVRVTVWYFED